MIYSASGFSDAGKKYGTEFHTVLQAGNIKFVEVNSGANTAPMETMTKGRVYVTVDKNTEVPKYITYFDKHNKIYKQIDLEHPHTIDGVKVQPHTHKWYEHNEKGDKTISVKEGKMIDRVLKTWYSK